MHKIIHAHCDKSLGNFKKWADKFTKDYDAILYFTRNYFKGCSG